MRMFFADKEGNMFLVTKQLGPSFEYNASELSQFWNDAVSFDFSKNLPFSLRRRPVKKLVANTRTEFMPIAAGEFIIKDDLADNPANRIYEAYNAEEIVNAKKENREAILIPHFSCHHFRHTFCTRFCENETNVKVIQSIMGHASIETTMDIYAEVTEMTKKKA